MAFSLLSPETLPNVGKHEDDRLGGEDLLQSQRRMTRWLVSTGQMWPTATHLELETHKQKALTTWNALN